MWHNMRANTKKGFSLVEVLLVVAILGILAGIVIFAIARVRASGRDTKRIAELRSLETAVASWASSHGFVPDPAGRVVSDTAAQETDSDNKIIRCNTTEIISGLEPEHCLAMKSTSPYFFGGSQSAFSTEGILPDKIKDPLDPTCFLVYITDGKDYEIMNTLELQTDRMVSDGGDNTMAYEHGTRLDLVGQWSDLPLDLQACVGGAPPPAPPTLDFSLTNSGNISVTRGGNVTNTITATIGSGVTQDVTFSISGLPTGATEQFSLTSCSPTCQSTLTITTMGSTPLGDSTIIVTGTAGSLTKTTQFILTVNAAPPPPPSGNFQQDPGADGLVVIEAEDYANNIPRSSLTWTSVASFSGYSGTSAMRVPEGGNTITTISSSPEMNYLVDFNRTGTHYIWIRGLNPTGTAQDDSVYIGIDGGTPQLMTINATAFTWVGGSASLNVPSTGAHTINVWMHEDAFVLDKLLLTTNAGYSPTGTGPGSSPPPPVFDFSLANSGNVSVTQGTGSTNTITGLLVSGTTQTVPLSVSTLAGTTLTLSPTSCNLTSNCSTLTITTTAGTPLGDSPITITSTVGSLTRTTQFILTVTSSVPPEQTWWNSSYGKRKLISSNTGYSSYVADTTFFNVSLNTTGPLFQDDGDDIRVVYQQNSGAKTELGRFVAGSNRTDTKIYFPTKGHTGENIGAQASYRYYIYYDCASSCGTPPSYTNPNDFIQAPLTTDGNTLGLWHLIDNGSDATGDSLHNFTNVQSTDFTSGARLGSTAADFNGTVDDAFNIPNGNDFYDKPEVTIDGWFWKDLWSPAGNPWGSHPEFTFSGTASAMVVGKMYNATQSQPLAFSENKWIYVRAHVIRTGAPSGPRIDAWAGDTGPSFNSITETSASRTAPPPTGVVPLYLGASQGANLWQGKVQEFRISTGSRPLPVAGTHYITTEAVLSLGAEEDAP